MKKKYKINFYKYGDWTPHDFQKGRKKSHEKKTKTSIKDFEIEDTDKLEAIRKKILRKLRFRNSNICSWQLTIKHGAAGLVITETNSSTFEELKKKSEAFDRNFQSDQATTLNLFESPDENNQSGTVWKRITAKNTNIERKDFLSRGKNKDSNKPEKDTNKRQSLFTRIEKTASFGQKPKNSKVISGGHRSTVKQNIKRFEKLSKKK